MRRALALVLGLFLSLIFVLPVMALDDAQVPPGRFVMAVGGDLTIPAGEVAETALVIRGHLDVQGSVTTVVVIDGTATVRGTTIGDLVVVRGTASVTDTVVTGDIRTLDARVEQVGTTVGGTVRGLEEDIVAMGWVIGVGAVLIWLGIGLATLVAGLGIAALAGRQVRATTAVIRREPLQVLLAGVLGVIVPPVLVGILIATIVGIPLGIGLLVVVWPLAAFVGYLVAAVWVGEWVLGLANARPMDAERPYRAMLVGLLVLFVAGFVPLVTAVVSLFGFGGLLVVGWQTARGAPAAGAMRQAPMPA